MDEQHGRKQQRRDAYLRSLLGAIGTLAVVLDRDQRIVRINRACETRLGRTSASVAGRHFADVFALQSELVSVRAALERICRTQPSGSIETHLLCKRGETRLIAWSCAALPPGRWEPAQCIATGIDITEQRHLEDALRFEVEASAMLSSSLDYKTTLDCVVKLMVPRLADWSALHLLQPDGSLRLLAVEHVDPALAQVCWDMDRQFRVALDGPSAIAMVAREGRSVLLPPLDEYILSQVAVSAEHRDVLQRIDFESGLVLALCVRGKPMGVLSLGVRRPRRAYNASDLALAEKIARSAAIAIENAELYREAQEAIHARELFLTMASHELRTPITTLGLQIQSLARSARRGLTERLTPERIAATAELIERQVKRLEILVNNLLDVSRMTDSPIELNLEEVDLSEIARDAVERLGPQFARVHSPVTFQADAPAKGRWDKARLDQVITHIVENAIKYGEGKPIEVTVTADARAAKLRVKDHGIGIASEDQERIFAPFAKGESERPYSGLGIGLWIAAQIAKAHGGSIGIESRPGMGSTFTLELPRGQEAVERAG
jgi:PAS domain S-box-containing protein